METILITNDPEVAADAEHAGISHVMVDLEYMGKKERQASRTTFLSTHTTADIAPVRAALTKAELIVRLNPWNEESPTELDAAIKGGADCIMLPMITDLKQIEEFVRALAGRARPIPLVETKYSMDHIAEIAAYPEIRELYLGLNDLHLSLGLDFLFEPLAMGLVDSMASQIIAAGKSFGFGGLAMMGSGELPAQRILGEHVRVGSSRVILSSRFCKDVDVVNADGRVERLTAALELMGSEETRLRARSAAEVEADKAETAAIIAKLAQSVRAARAG